MSTMMVKLLPCFYDADFTDLPESTELDDTNLVLWLRQDNKRGAVIEGTVAIWTGNEDGDDEDYYTAALPLEDPGDANYEGSAAVAVRSAMTETGITR